MKRIVIILFALILLLACVPTPEADAVKQKDTNVLIDTVLSEEAERGEAALTPVKTQFPDRFQCDFDTSVSNVHVTADVPIRVKTDSGFPLVRVEHRRLTNEERLEIYRRLFGKDDLYIWERHPRTREDVTNRIRILMDALDYRPEDKAEWMRNTDSTESEWEEMLERNRQEIEALKQEYNSLPEQSAVEPNKPWDGTVPEDNPNPNSWNILEVVGGADEQLETWKYDHANIEEYSRDSNIRFFRRISEDEFSTGSHSFFAYAKSSIRIDPSAYAAKQDGAALTALEAADLAKSILGGVAEDYGIADIYWCNDAYLDGDAKGSFNTWGYLVLLTPNVQGASMLFAANAAYENSDDAYYRSWPYDCIEVSVDSAGGIMGFSWSGALNCTEVLSETTTLLPYEKISEITKQQLNFAWNGQEDYENGSIVIDDVQLGLFRIREKNDMEHGLLVPVWFITGTFRYAPEHVEYGITERRFDMMNPLLVINAIDGTVINPMQGY